MWAYQGLGETALGQADAATARQWLSAGLQLSRELGAQIMIAWCLAGLGSAAALDEEPERAARLWGAAEHLRVTLGCRPAPGRSRHLRAAARAGARPAWRRSIRRRLGRGRGAVAGAGDRRGAGWQR